LPFIPVLSSDNFHLELRNRVIKNLNMMIRSSLGLVKFTANPVRMIQVKPKGKKRNVENQNKWSADRSEKNKIIALISNFSLTN
jgi:hypothetical protein